MLKQFVALARVSSREQEREGFSLEVQESALRRHATEHGGEIARLFRVAETATKSDERLTFKSLLAYVRKNAASLDGVLFYKVDRGARNLYDYVELERLEGQYGVRVEYITQPTENSPAGRMMRRTLANMASFYTEQQSELWFAFLYSLHSQWVYLVLEKNRALKQFLQSKLFVS